MSRERVVALERRVAELESRLAAVLVDSAGVDVSARERLLIEAERLVHTGSWIWDTTTNSVLWSDELFRILGFDPKIDKACATAFFERIHEGDAERVQGLAKATLASGETEEVAFRVQRGDGSVRHVVMASTAIKADDGRMTHLVGTVLDVTDETHRRDELARVASELADAQAMAGVGSWEWDRSTDEIRWSPELYRILGVDPQASVQPLRIRSLVHPADLARHDAAALAVLEGADGAAGAAEFRIVRPDGSVRHLSARGRRVDAHGGNRYRGTLLDVTDRLRLEADLRDAQKLEAIGRLAGGVAHDFNNSLTVILANAELLARRQESEELSAIMDAANGAASLTRQLLAFGRRAVMAPTVISVTAAVESAAGLARRVIGEDIELQMALADDAWCVRLDSGLLQQMLLNLAINARDAMPSGGTLTLETKNVVLGAEHQREHPDATLGEHVVVTVSDTGIGMDEETRARAFEPFFTTKGNGRGTGLGLPMVFGGVKQSGGSMTIDSAVGVGTRIRLYFPRAIEAPLLRVAPSAPPSSPARAGEPGRAVLVVEDDPAVAKTIAQMLDSAGYDVRVAPRPSVALDLAESHSGPLPLVILDIMLPEMTGPRLALELRARGLARRFLFITGYPSEVAQNSKGAPPLGPSLAKPFSACELLEAVATLLHGVPSRDDSASATPAA